MNKYKLQLSEGFEVVEGKKLTIMENIKNQMLELYSSYGYTKIKTPTLEYIDVFCNSLQKPELYSLINRHGEILALSSDMTSSIARYISTKKEEIGPIRYSYFSDIFRYPRLYQGRSHEFTQVGLELINSSSIKADIEIISLAYKSIKLCNLKSFNIHLSSSRFLSNLFLSQNLSFDIIDKINDTIARKDFVYLKELLKNNLTNYEDIYNLFITGGDISYLDKLIIKYNNDEELLYLKTLYNNLLNIGINNIYFDFTISNYANYYTGIIFQIYSNEIPEAILSGGRYDNLYKSFYKDYKACGFGINISLISNYILNNNLDDKKRIYYLSDDKSIDIKNKDISKYIDKGYQTIDLFDIDLSLAKKIAKDNNSKLIIYKNNEIIEV